MKGKIPN